MGQTKTFQPTCACTNPLKAKHLSRSAFSWAKVRTCMFACIGNRMVCLEVYTVHPFLDMVFTSLAITYLAMLGSLPLCIV